MYAVFSDGSRQYRVQEGDVVRVDFRDVPKGETIEFNRVLLLKTEGDLQIGQPVLEGARVVGEVVDHPAVKLYIQHFRKRKGYRKLRGHRQPYTSVRVQYLLKAGQQPPARKEEPTAKPQEQAETSAAPAGEQA